MDADGPSPFDEWSALTDAQRDEVTRLARRGQAHPDPEVRRVARRWATTIVEAESDRWFVRWMPDLVSRLIVVVLALDLPFLPGEDAMERRWAVRVLEAK